MLQDREQNYTINDCPVIASLTGYISAKHSGDSIFLNAHPYHTKVPPSIIDKHILHYTKPGDIVLDPFCGSGMTGVSALRNNRKAFLNDLSPAAVHIASGYLELVSSCSLEKAKLKVLDEVEKELRNLYNTQCPRCGGTAQIAYLIWSDVVSCPYCTHPLVIWEHCVDLDTGVVKASFNCPSCNGIIEKKRLTGYRLYSKPVVTVCDCENGCLPKRNEHLTTKEEQELLLQIDNTPLCSDAPIVSMMNTIPGIRWGEQYRVGYHKDVTHAHHFFTRRNFIALNRLYRGIMNYPNLEERKKLLFAFTGSLFAVSRMVKYIPSRGGRSNLPGTLYIPSINLEQNVLSVFSRRLEKVIKICEWREALDNQPYVIATQINTGTAECLPLLDESIDYIFTDPPFGRNIQYAELNFIHEIWLNNYTDTDREIVINKQRNQSFVRYFALLEKCLQEMFRVLKTGRYLSFVFNNTDPLVWNALQEAIFNTGFVLEGVVMLDKGKGGWNQVTSIEGTARYDVILQLQKPYGKYIDRKLPDANLDTLFEHIENILKGVSPVSRKERTTPYIHSVIVQYILTHRSNISPPKPSQLEKLLGEKFYQEKGLWYARS